MCNKIAMYELIETVVSTNATRQTFNDIPQLRNQDDQKIIIRNIEFFTAAVYGNSQQNQATAGIPNTEIKKVVLVLFLMGSERLHYIPLAKLNTINDLSGSAPFQVIGNSFDDLQSVDWNKSYFQYNAAPVPTYIIPLGITYVKLNAKGN